MTLTLTSTAQLPAVIDRADIVAGVATQVVPTLIAASGARASTRFLEFFAANIRNPHTRQAYGRAVAASLAWCEEHGARSIEVGHCSVTSPGGTKHLAPLRRAVPVSSLPFWWRLLPHDAFVEGEQTDLGRRRPMPLTPVLLSSTLRQEVTMTAKTSISLTDDQDAYARALVESGQYPSLSAVLQRGLEMLRRDNEMRDAELQALRSLIDQRRAGAFVDLDEGEAEARAMLERKRKARATL